MKFQLLNQQLRSLLDRKAFYTEHDHSGQIIVWFVSICFNFEWISQLDSLSGIFNIVQNVKYLPIAFSLLFLTAGFCWWMFKDSRDCRSCIYWNKNKMHLHFSVLFFVWNWLIHMQSLINICGIENYLQIQYLHVATNCIWFWTQGGAGSTFDVFTIR